MTAQKNKALFESVPIPRAVAAIAIPTVVGQLIVLIYSLADTFFLGRTNDPVMVGAASLILPVFNISLSLASITGVGGSALLSRLLGKGREDEARKVYSFSVYFSLGVAAFFSLAVLLFLMNAIFGMYGIVWSQLCADILTVLLSLIVHRIYLKKHKELEGIVVPSEV